MAKKNEPPKALKVKIHHARFLRAYGNDETERYAAGSIVELARGNALELVGAGLADGVEASTKASKPAADKPKSSKPAAA